MRSNNVFECYKSGINKLHARSGLFEGTELPDRLPAQRLPTVAVRPRYGAYIAAAVILALAAAGTVIISRNIRTDSSRAGTAPGANDIETGSGIGSVATDEPQFVGIVSAYRVHDLNRHQLIAEYFRREPSNKAESDKLSSEMNSELEKLQTAEAQALAVGDTEAASKASEEKRSAESRYRQLIADKRSELRIEIQKKIEAETEHCTAAIIELQKRGSGIIPLSAFRYEGEDTVYLTVYNGMPHGSELSGHIKLYKDDTGEIYDECSIGPDELNPRKLSLTPGRITTISIVPHKELDAVLCVKLGGSEAAQFRYDFSDIMSSPARRKINEFYSDTAWSKPYAAAVLTGDTDPTAPKLDLEAAREIIARCKDFDAIANEFSEYQPYPDEAGGSGISHIIYGTAATGRISVMLEQKTVFYSVCDEDGSELSGETLFQG